MKNKHLKTAKQASTFLLALSAAILVAACGGGSGTATDTATPAAAPTPTPSPAATPTPAATPSPAATPTPTPTPAATPTPTPAPTPAPTPTSIFRLVPKAGGGTYALTECVFDSFTGLMWQGRTTTGLRASYNYYTNYDDTTSLQINYPLGGLPGPLAPTLAQVNASDNSVGFKNAVNATALCGYSDWRLPSRDDLRSLEYTTETNPIAWFPNIGTSHFWSSTLGTADAGAAYSVDVAGPMPNVSLQRSSRISVMLVR
jgi:hypothetical protein